jgi:hypothetical protein
MNRLRAEAIKTRRLASNSFAIHADRGVSLDSAFFGDSSASAMVLVAFSRERKPRALLFAPDKCNINGVNWPGFANENHLRAIRLLPTRLFHPQGGSRSFERKFSVLSSHVFDARLDLGVLSLERPSRAGSFWISTARLSTCNL